jgi:hypothetical protein
MARLVSRLPLLKEGRGRRTVLPSPVDRILTLILATTVSGLSFRYLFKGPND